MNQARKRTGTKKVLSMILVLVMLLSLLSMAAFTLPASETGNSKDAYEYNIMFLDCGRKYFSVDSIKQIIDNASDAGFNYIQLAVGNDGLRFLLDDMSLTVGNQTYDSSAVKVAIHKGNTDYNATFKEAVTQDTQEKCQYNPKINELTQSEMDTIIAYAASKGMGVIPCVNTPGHMDAILSAANSLTQTNCSYNGSARTIDVTNPTAVAFTKALLQKYIDYFAGKGCQLFNMGADEYANDKFPGGAMGFGNLQTEGNYSYYVNYVNDVAAKIKEAGMKPMAFNDGIYFANNDTSGKFDTDIIVCYWSNGWPGYTPMPASTLASKGFKLINTNGGYYWVLGKKDKCSEAKASGFNKNSFPGSTSTINDPAGSMFCIWSDYPGAESEADVISKTAATITAFGATLPNLTSGTVTPTPTTPTPETITVAVGGTKTVTADGYYNGSYETEDTTIATASAVGTAAVDRTENEVTTIESGKQYLIVHKRSGLVLNDSTSGNGILLGEKANSSDQLWTITKYSSSSSNAYTIQGVAKNYITAIGSGSATLGTSNGYVQMAYNSDGYWNIYDRPYWTNYYLNQYGGTSSTMAAGFTNDGASDDGSQWQIYQVTPGTKATTTITFSGVSKGTTTVTIGNVKYTINVVDQALADATPLTVEYWITNKKVTAGGATSKQIKADPSVYSETGAKFSGLVPATGTQGNNTDVFWKGTRLTSANKQTDESGVDRTRAGDDFAYIRYWEQKWSFSADGTSWTDFNDDDQVVAYYLQKTDVTSEITTNVVDWGQPYSEWKAGGGDNGWFWNGYVANGSKYVFLDFAVVYEDNTQNPSSFPTDKTLFYHFDRCSETNPRVLGAISFTENSDYEIWKVTVTDGTSTGYSSYSTFAPTYDNTTETTVWDESMGGIPQIDQLKYTANRSGKLVRVYVRAKVTEDSLTVNYFDENNTSLPFYSYNIAVASGTTFSNQFAYVPGNANENGSLSNNTVVNIKGVTQTVNWQLEKMSEIGAQYRFGNYTFTNATKETGNKVVNLYYRFNSEKTFVVDFGLPLHITMTDISPLLNQANVEGVAVGNSLYATVRANSDFSIDYILNKTIDGSDRITVTYTGTKVSGESDSATYNLTIIPATSVYYEDSFATFTPGTGKASGATWSIVDNDGKVTEDKSTAKNQALTELHKMSPDAVYGYDAAYAADSTKLSMGSAHKVTVKSDMYVKDDTVTTWPSATFTFKGTGFDVISLTSNTSGSVVYTVTGKKTGYTETHLVDTYYGYKLVDNKWVVDQNSNSTLYQIPVIKVTGLAYDEYTVTLSVRYGEFFDHQGKGNYSFWLDAIRVYDPMGVNNATYVDDGEGYPQYIMLRNALVAENVESALFIDGAAEAKIADYKVYGPNNEVYLENGQAITFNVPADGNIESIQIGAKAPDGSNSAKMVVNQNEAGAKVIQSATEMYYEISKVGTNFTITNMGDGILSLTNLKITFKGEPDSTITLTPLSTDEQNTAVMSVRALFAAPEQTFEPEYFTAKWSRNVRKGGTATLTVKASADVEAITVNGEEITTYTTKTARSVWGAKETYHVFTYRVPNAATATYSICAVNGEGAVSDPITAKLTVRPSIRDWWNDIFDKWKH